MPDCFRFRASLREEGEYAPPWEIVAVCWSTAGDRATDWRRAEQIVLIATGRADARNMRESIAAAWLARKMRRNAKRLAREKTEFGLTCLLANREHRLKVLIAHSEGPVDVLMPLTRERQMIHEAALALDLKRRQVPPASSVGAVR